MEVCDDLSLLSEPIRVRLLAALGEDNLSVGELEKILVCPQSTVSRHLKRLVNAGWVHRRQAGTSAHYMRSPRNDTAEELLAFTLRAFAQTATAAQDRARRTAVIAGRSQAGFFGRHANSWAELRRGLFGDNFLLPALLCMVPSDQTVLDVGCGTGELVEALSPFVDNVIGVDREQAMLDAATVRAPNLDLRLGGAENLPVDSAQVDWVFTMLLLHHLEELAPAMNEFRRVLRAQGRLVIVDMISHNQEQLRRSMGHKHLGFAEPRLRALAQAAGFRVERYVQLPRQEGAQGPTLFLCVMRADS